MFLITLIYIITFFNSLNQEKEFIYIILILYLYL